MDVTRGYYKLRYQVIIMNGDCKGLKRKKGMGRERKGWEGKGKEGMGRGSSVTNLNILPYTLSFWGQTVPDLCVLG